MANIWRAIKPWASQVMRTWVTNGVISQCRSRTNLTRVVNYGALSPEMAMNITFSRQARSIERLLIMSRL